MEDGKIKIVLGKEDGKEPRVVIPAERWEELLPPELHEKLTQGCPVCGHGEEEAKEIFKDIDSVVLHDVEVVQ